MALLTPTLLSLRHDPRVLKLPPYLSLLCILIGVGWLLLLPLNDYSRRTYVSENALLPAQVHTYFGGSEHDVFRAYRHEVAGLAGRESEDIFNELAKILASQGLKVGTQRYRYEAPGRTITGHNTYAILQGPRADATESIVLAAPWRDMDDILNQSGVALVLALARYFKRWSLWSKDIIILITEDSTAGPQAWVDAYHDMHDATSIDDLPLKAGALQGVLVLNYPAGPGGHRYDKLHVIYEGINGQQPNLDLFNTAIDIAKGQMGVDTVIQRMWNHNDGYKARLETLGRGMVCQGLGHATGPHSAFIPYHVDAITLQTIGDGWHDEMTMGRVVESTFRSLNNLLEHLHQSFFFYLLMDSYRFVSIGTYLPSAMLVAINFSIMSIALWVRSGRSARPVKGKTSSGSHKLREQKEAVIEQDGLVAVIPGQMLTTEERKLFLPIAFFSGVHLAGLLPLYIFNNVTPQAMPTTLIQMFWFAVPAPHICAYVLHKLARPSSQQITLISCFSLLLLGVSLATLSTLNFSLGLIIGLLATPLTFAPLASRKRVFAAPYSVLLYLFSPPVVLIAAGYVWKGGNLREAIQAAGDIVSLASLSWAVHGTWTMVVVCLLWWPAWFIAQVLLCAHIYLDV